MSEARSKLLERQKVEEDDIERAAQLLTDTIKMMGFDTDDCIIDSRNQDQWQRKKINIEQNQSQF